MFGILLTKLHARLVRKIRSLVAKPAFFKIWFLPVWCLLGVSKIMILKAKFCQMEKFLGRKLGVSVLVPLLDSKQQNRAIQVGHVVRVVSHYTPWESNCFPQALTALIMLRLYRVPYLLSFGLRRCASTRDCQAHVWLVAGPVCVTGGYGFSSYALVGSYLSPHINISIDSENC
ncbi:lasso peptide biosynthesis B2 protein [Billgrantia montanilacus]|uniref:Lasso peptide biosynthesis B2 protein n=1 Tax=Billgrantia montanilacus TaxID=2282305 RepID=A0A368U3E3_9GAMM|nr:lasso peptide biosynthesis B2 protein [Halomonas montanilacus]RCV91007.1 lasso peptide biosynthesis B2 protein [Halomonas montanilacus]